MWLCLDLFMIFLVPNVGRKKGCSKDVIISYLTAWSIIVGCVCTWRWLPHDNIWCLREKDECRKKLIFLSTNYYEINLILLQRLHTFVSIGSPTFDNGCIKTSCSFLSTMPFLDFSLIQTCGTLYLKTFTFLIYIEYQSICFEQLR